MTRRANGEGTIYRRSDERWEAALYVPDEKLAGGQTEVAVLGGGQTGVGGRSNEGRPEVKRRSLRRVHVMRPPPERDAAATGLGSPEAGTNLRQTPRLRGQANPVNDLSATRIHVALTLDRLHAVGHHPIIGAWPSLLLVTSSASLQLDPANGLSAAQAMRISGRLLIEVTRWHESIRRHAPTPRDSAEAGLMLQAEWG